MSVKSNAKLNLSAFMIFYKQLNSNRPALLCINTILTDVKYQKSLYTTSFSGEILADDRRIFTQNFAETRLLKRLFA